MKVGDLVKMIHGSWVGVIVDFLSFYDKWGEPYEKYAIVNWNSDYPDEREHINDIEVINGNE